MSARIPFRLREATPTLSFEFYPPKTERGWNTLTACVDELAAERPDFVSVTYGAGGSTRDTTIAVVDDIRRRTGLRTVMHLTCVGATRAALTDLAGELARRGITDVLALRGDPPGGPAERWVATAGGLRYASELVALLRDVGQFDIGVAAFPEGHPASDSRRDDIVHLARKCAAGADYAVTQFFFEVDQYVALVQELRDLGCDTPVIPGVLPVTNPARTRRFAAVAGATIPAELDAAFRAVEHDPEAVIALGVERATRLALDLIAAGAPGLHIYTLNRSHATRAMCVALRDAGALGPADDGRLVPSIPSP